ncbi:DNA polymerase III subunit beta family protein [Actinorugispora endophytica]|uniref:DNA polymerase III sliding clamp (Beta) subunit (PCNA family) n=1 Tax=Actinorugispora endophytica TaxID=1605990 RepID=A0A4R6V580_9ACTN|nr:MerR family transcriptional regulator [Actinorugispora endophytica]TDQ55501.1 DNA polymerase III sliding clamp (beta) subunit (PCNA family) [Actinorugispora endophytica]
MDDTGSLLGIGAFARRVGLAPSALRFYDDCGVLRPALVDGATGYRYYDPGQEPRAVLVRRLREAGLPLVDASVVLDGPRDEAREVLEGHARRTMDTATAARSVVEDILRDLPDGAHRAGARIGGAELASAVRQVAPAVASAAVRKEFPVLGCVLVELDGQEVRLVATDRYRMAVRVLRPAFIHGGPLRVPVDASEMREAASWALRLPEVDVEVEGRSVLVRGGGESRTLSAVDGEFPLYRTVLDDLPAVRNRVITDRDVLRRILAGVGGDGPVVLSAEGQRVAVSGRGPGETGLRAICAGPPLRVAFDPGVLLPALDAGVGPDVLLEVASPTLPVVVRSADQGSFTTLVMPVRDLPAGA